MSGEERWRDLAQRTAERARLRGEQRSAPGVEAEPGDAAAGEVLALPEGIDAGLRWVVLAVEDGAAVVAPADLSPAVGEGDLALGSESGLGALVLRAALALEIPVACLERERRVGRLGAGDLARALRLREALESGELRAGLTAREVGDDLEHREWLDDEVLPAREALRRRARQDCAPEEGGDGADEADRAVTPGETAGGAETDAPASASRKTEGRTEEPATASPGRLEARMPRAEEKERAYETPSFSRRFLRSGLLAACLALVVAGLAAWSVGQQGRLARAREELEALKHPAPARVVYFDAALTVRSGDVLRVDGSRPAVFDMDIDPDWRKRGDARVVVTGPNGSEVFSAPLVPEENAAEEGRFGLLLPPDLAPGAYDISFLAGSDDEPELLAQRVFQVTGGDS